MAKGEPVVVRRLDPAGDTALLPALADLLVEAVAGGASISFMAGYTPDEALAFWTAKVAAPGMIVLVALEGAALLGTVTLAMDTPPNQPHRADVQKMIVAEVARRRGIGAALITAVEAEARTETRTMLVLDTISFSDAARLYERCGWTRAGEIPDYALMPAGGLAPTTVYFKRL